MLAIVIGLTIIVDVMNAPSLQMNDLLSKEAKLVKAISLLESALAPEAIVMAINLRAQLAITRDLISEMKAKG